MTLLQMSKDSLGVMLDRASAVPFSLLVVLPVLAIATKIRRARGKKAARLFLIPTTLILLAAAFFLALFQIRQIGR